VGPRRRAAVACLRRFSPCAFWLRALVGLLLALERRRIAHPRLRTTPIFKEVLQQGFAAGEMGLRSTSLEQALNSGAVLPATAAAVLGTSALYGHQLGGQQ